MFTAKGLFSEVICPYQETCTLPRCIFKHIDPKLRAFKPAITSQNQLSVKDDRGGQRKRQKLDIENELPSSTAKANGTDKESSQLSIPSSKAIEKPSKRSFAATREISPPPIKRKTENETSSYISSRQYQPQKALAMPKPSVKAPLKKEGLNPRVLKHPSPASHDMRFKLLKALHTEFARLNTELAKDASDEEEKLVLSEQELITRALDLEEIATASQAVYSNLVKNKIMTYKRMSIKQWVDERRKEVAQEEAKEAAVQTSTPISKPSGPPKVIETGLSTKEELTLLHRLYTPISGLSSHGYVSTIPTETEIQTAKQGIEAAKGWEVCDRCKARFQVFPGRREEDGALASGGKCTYHFGKPYWQDRSPSAPKAKREKKYRCCDESMGDSSGCTTSENHVFKITEVKRLAAILNFEKTPENPGLVDERPVCIDGEMGYTVYGLELIRLTATSWPSGAPIFDVLVRPLGPLLDLNSRYSGVWPGDMASALPWSESTSDEPSPSPSALISKPALRIVSSPSAARSLLFSHLSPSTPLIGHGLENDLNAVRMIHPTIIDTALLYPHKAGLPYRNGLKALMATHLNHHIQVVVGGKMEGHDSKEDANAAGALVRLRLAEDWARLKREGWVVKEGTCCPPGGLSVEMLEKEVPVKKSNGDSVGRKRDRSEMEDGEVNG
ncbi:related to REX3-RNA exonuclease, member of the family of 3`-5` exonucleases [Rhynchosporium secalis]|uniref:Related to REX3-RNA exonuclease, member of the family of 3`-5` exonucleases n=1 Tax=Rhynchosporium secalis TaxID=38038 RepID=A0A1E1M8U5_RHYSE|nr:related to REX3-RNA exonuclease, member of the family of 3`-5` exonucleases [Rhynchosporium secalis]